MPLMYKIINIRLHAPVKVHCDKPVHPNLDADGDVIYENTHFLKEKDAWDALVTEWESGVAIETREVMRLKASLSESEKDLSENCIGFEMAKTNRDKWSYKNKDKKKK